MLLRTRHGHHRVELQVLQAHLRAKNHTQARRRAAEVAIHVVRKVHRKAQQSEATAVNQAAARRTRQARRTTHHAQAAARRTHQVRTALLGQAAVHRTAHRTEVRHVVARRIVRLQEDSIIKSFMYICKK